MRVWDGASKDERKNFKLKVEYNYPDLGSPQKSKNNSESAGNEKENASRDSDIKHNIRKLEKKRVEEDDEENLETATSDFINLKTKYSTLVEYTVCLVAERDTIARKLEESDRDLARENARRKEIGISTDTNKIKKVERITQKGNHPKVRNSEFFFLTCSCESFFMIILFSVSLLLGLASSRYCNVVYDLSIRSLHFQL